MRITSMVDCSECKTTIAKRLGRCCAGICKPSNGCLALISGAFSTALLSGVVHVRAVAAGARRSVRGSVTVARIGTVDWLDHVRVISWVSFTLRSDLEWYFEPKWRDWSSVLGFRRDKRPELPQNDVVCKLSRFGWVHKACNIFGSLIGSLCVPQLERASPRLAITAKSEPHSAHLRWVVQIA